MYNSTRNSSLNALDQIENPFDSLVPSSSSSNPRPHPYSIVNQSSSNSEFSTLPKMSRSASVPGSYNNQTNHHLPTQYSNQTKLLPTSTPPSPIPVTTLPSINVVAPFAREDSTTSLTTAKFSPILNEKPTFGNDNFGTCNNTAGTSSSNDIQLSDFLPHTKVMPASTSSTKSFKRFYPKSLPSMKRIESIIWALSPLLLHIIGALLLVMAMVERRMPYMTVYQIGQPNGLNGRLDYYILHACAIAPGTTNETCTSQSIRANFLSSIALVSQSMPGFTPLKLLFFSDQSPAIMLAAVVTLFVSLYFYLPLWILAYFPHKTILPSFITNFYRYHSKLAFILSFSLIFPAFVISLTISLGYRLLLQGFIEDFNLNMLASVQNGLIGGSITVWRARHGPGFNLLWSSVAFQAANVVAIVVAMHNGLDEIVEWPEMQKEKVFW